jgi:hypothetical protein
MRTRSGLLTSLLLLAASAVHASGSFQIQSAFLTVRDGAYELNARVIYPLNDDVRSALTNGATVKLVLQAEIEKHRRYWLDDTLIEANLRRELSWNAVSQRYILKDIHSGNQDSYAALDEALIAAGVVNGWPVLPKHRLDRDTSYQIRVRAIYRSSQIPDALQALAFWSDGWSSKTGWKSWTLPR